MVAEPVGDRALHRHDRPVGPLRRIGARQHFLGLFELAVVGERLAVGAEHFEIMRRLDRRRLHHRRRFAVAGQRAQRPRVIDRGDLLAGIAVVALAPIVGVGAQARFVGRQRLLGRGDRAGHRRRGPGSRRAARRRSAGRRARPRRGGWKKTEIRCGMTWGAHRWRPRQQ